jgi:hypothetical protein
LLTFLSSNKGATTLDIMPPGIMTFCKMALIVTKCNTTTLSFTTVGIMTLRMTVKNGSLGKTLYQVSLS